MYQRANHVRCSAVSAPGPFGPAIDTTGMRKPTQLAGVISPSTPSAPHRATIAAR